MFTNLLVMHQSLWDVRKLELNQWLQVFDRAWSLCIHESQHYWIKPALENGVFSNTTLLNVWKIRFWTVRPAKSVALAPPSTCTLMRIFSKPVLSKALFAECFNSSGSGVVTGAALGMFTVPPHTPLHMPNKQCARHASCETLIYFKLWFTRREHNKHLTFWVPCYD